MRTHANQQFTATAWPSFGDSSDPSKTSTCVRVCVCLSDEGDTASRAGRGALTPALKAVPSAPKIKNPKTDKTEQHVARFVLTSGRDIVEVMKVEWGGGRR